MRTDATFKFYSDQLMNILPCPIGDAKMMTGSCGRCIPALGELLGSVLTARGSMSDAVWMAAAEVVGSITSALRPQPPGSLSWLRKGTWIQNPLFGNDKFIIEMVRRFTKPGYFVIRREPSRSGLRESFLQSCDPANLLAWRKCPRREET